MIKKLKKHTINIKNWILEHKKEALVIFGILLLGAILRLYKIDQYMTFLGDEGRDAIVVRRLIVYQDPILIGPGTSIGNMYLGPLYYYFIAPALLVANFSPAGPSILVAITGIVTIGFIYFIAREWFGRVAAIVASLLYAVSPTVIIYSRSSWNPNIMPFFSLLSIYSIYRVWKSKEYKWLIVLGIAYAFVLNSHYLGLILTPVIGLIWIFSFIQEKENKKKLLVNSLLGLVVFLFLMSPLAIFDLRHNGMNFKAIKAFFTMRETTVSIKPWKALPAMWPQYQQYSTRLTGGRNEVMGLVISIFNAVLLVFFLIKTKLKLLTKKHYFILLLWIGAATLGLGLYKQHIYDHYYGFFFAAPFLLLSAMYQEVFNFKVKIINIVLSVFFVAILVVNFLQNPLQYAPNRQMQRAQDVSREIIDLAQNEKINFALIAESNYDSGYRYFLDLYGAKVVDIDPQHASSTIQKNLYVVCEMPKEKCDPTHNPKAEVAGFGWSKVEETWNVDGITIFRLGHTK